MVAERIPSEGSESAGAQLRGWEEARRERGGSEGAETLRAWRARGVQGAYSVRTCAVQSAWARPPRASVECSASTSERSSTRVRQLSESEALTSARGKHASDSSSTRECKPSHTRVIRSRVLPYL